MLVMRVGHKTRRQATRNSWEIDMPRHGRRALKLRHRLYEILEHGPVGDRVGRLVGRLIVLLIVINLVAITLKSIPEFEAQYTALFIAIELVSLAVFRSNTDCGCGSRSNRRLICIRPAGRRGSDTRRARLG